MALTGGAGADASISANMPILNEILVETLRSPAVSTLIAGLALGALARPDAVFDGFYEPLFWGLLSILMLIMRMEAG